MQASNSIVKKAVVVVNRRFHQLLGKGGPDGRSLQNGYFCANYGPFVGVEPRCHLIGRPRGPPWRLGTTIYRSTLRRKIPMAPKPVTNQSCGWGNNRNLMPPITIAHDMTKKKMKPKKYHAMVRNIMSAHITVSMP